MGHPKSFPLKFVAIGNEDCDEEFYQGKVRFLTYATIKNLFFVIYIGVYKNFRTELMSVPICISTNQHSFSVNLYTKFSSSFGPSFPFSCY